MIRVLLLLTVLGAGYFAYPYYTLWRVEAAIRDKDPIALDAIVDWEKVRGSLKEEFLSGFGKSLPSGGAEAAGAALGLTIGSAMIERMLESLANSKSLINIITKEGTADKFSEKISVSGSFLSPTRFKVVLTPKNEINPVTATGLFALQGVDWRLERIAFSKPLSDIPQVAEIAGRASAMPSPPAPAASPAVKSDPLPVVPPVVAEWDIKESKSPLDDAREVSGFLSPHTGEGMFLLRCKENTTEAAILTSKFLGVNDPVKVIYRINDAPAVTSQWSSSTSHKGAFAPSAIQFIKSLPNNAEFFIRVHDYQGQGHDLAFKTGNVEGIRAKISETCRWPVILDTPLKPSAARQPSPTSLAPSLR